MTGLRSKRDIGTTQSIFQVAFEERKKEEGAFVTFIVDFNPTKIKAS